MKTQLLTTLVGLAIFTVPAAVPASQPEVRLADLEPEFRLTTAEIDLSVLYADPAQTAELSIVLPTGFTMLDVSADPFAR